MGRRMQIGAADLRRRPLADKLLHSECNGTSAQKGYLLPFKVYTMERIYENNLKDGKTYECKAIKPE